jgi:phage baseplate assembly protein W
MQLDFPLQLDGRGRTAGAGEDDHVRDLVEQVLFTSPGERVNRPDFGTGLLQLVFAGASEELASATQFLVQGGLQQWLGERIHVDSVSARSDEGLLEVTVAYVVRRTGERRTTTLSRAL